MWAARAPALILQPTTTETDKYLAYAPARKPSFIKAVDFLIRSLKNMSSDTKSVWNGTDVLYMFCAPDQTSAFINIKNPAANTCTIGANTVTFVPNSGVETDGATGYVDTNFNLSTATNYAQDSAHVFVYDYVTGTNAGSNVGFFDGTDGLTMTAHNGSSLGAFRVNQASQTIQTTGSVTLPGVYWARRTGAATTNHGNVSLKGPTIISDGGLNTTTNPNQASVAVNNNNLWVGRTSAAGFVVTKFRALMVGSSNSQFQTGPARSIHYAVNLCGVI